VTRVAARAFFALALWTAQAPLGPPTVTIPGTDIAMRRGWRLSITGACRSAVPVEWHHESDAFFWSPSGWRLTIASVHVSSWERHKADVRRAVVGLVAIRDDSERRLWIESRHAIRLEEHVAVNAGDHVCVGILDGPADGNLAPDIVDAIVDSVGPAPAGWPPSTPDSSCVHERDDRLPREPVTCLTIPVHGARRVGCEPLNRCPF
jgi:hypothetical protein